MIAVVDNGIRNRDGQPIMWFRLRQNDGREVFRAVLLHRLAVIPISSKEDYDLLGKQWAAVRGLYNAGVDFVYSTLGIYRPDHVGIVQFYGAAANGDTLDEAERLARQRLAAVLATLANYPQSQTVPPETQFMAWYLDFVMSSKRILALLGHPDPRETRRGLLGEDGELPNNTGADLAAEQNEILFRGLAKLQRNFIFQTTAAHVSRRRLAEALVRVAQVASIVASRQRGAINIGFGVSVPIMAALSRGVSAGQSVAHSQTHSTAEGVSQGWGVGHTHGTAHTDSITQTTGGGVTHTVSNGVAHGQSHSISRSVTDGVAHTTSQSVTDSSSSTVAHGVTQSGSATTSSNVTSTVSQSQSLTNSSSQTSNWARQHSATLQQGGDASGDFVILRGGYKKSVAELQGLSWGQASTQGTANTTTTGGALSTGAGTAYTSGLANSSSVASTTGHAVSHGTADTTSHAVSRGEAWGTSQVKSHGEATSVSSFWSTSRGHSDTVSQSDSTSQNWGRSHTEGNANAVAAGNAAGAVWGAGLSGGLVPSASVGRSWQTEDDTAIRLTEILRGLEGLLNQASAEGGFMTSALLFTEDNEAAAAAESLVPQAFHGPNVPTPVLTIPPDPQDEEQLRLHALALLPWEDSPQDGDPFHGILWHKYDTLLTAGQVAAYTAPSLLEEGSAVTVIAPIPEGMGFYPDMPGDVVLGHQYSPTTHDLTNAPVRLDKKHLFHTMFAGDTGWGKSVSAVRMAYETTLHWHTRTVVLDFGAGWRALLNAPGLEGHVDIRQLWPDAPRPLRWNPLQIGRNIDPETQWRAFADIFGSIAKLGVRRQKQELLDALRTVYLKAGVLVDDPEIRNDPVWGRVRADEADAVGVDANTPLGDLTWQQKQAVAVLRSSRVGLSDLYRQVETKLRDVPPRDTMLQGVLEGILYRLNPLVQGAASRLFASGTDVVPVEDMARPWGVLVVEGGSFLDDFGKAFLLGWLGWHLYTDMMARRVRHLSAPDEPLLQIFFEEANKIFGGIEQDSSDTEGISAAQRFGDMFRDARKYGVRLHIITQAPSLIPPDIVSSCNNLSIAFLKQPKDKDIVLSALARSEKGFRDEEWRRFLSDMGIGMAIGRFPYDEDRARQRPILYRPLMLDVPEPDDEEIARKLGRLAV